MKTIRRSNDWWNAKSKAYHCKLDLDFKNNIQPQSGLNGASLRVFKKMFIFSKLLQFEK